jgi:hypothetical protein
MKKKLKIRFVARCKGASTKATDYLIQQKKWYGWKYIRYSVDTGYGSLNYLYRKNTKKELLRYVLDNHFQVGSKFVQIEEYPMIKTY